MCNFKVSTKYLSQKWMIKYLCESFFQFCRSKFSYKNNGKPLKNYIHIIVNNNRTKNFLKTLWHINDIWYINFIWQNKEVHEWTFMIKYDIWYISRRIYLSKWINKNGPKILNIVMKEEKYEQKKKEHSLMINLEVYGKWDRNMSWMIWQKFLYHTNNKNIIVTVKHIHKLLNILQVLRIIHANWWIRTTLTEWQ